MTSLEGHSEPSWFKDIKFDDSDTEQLADENDLITTSAKSLDSTACIFGHLSSARIHLTFQDRFCFSGSASPSKRTSVSSFHSAVDSDSAASINLNVEQDNVNFHIKKQAKYPHVPPHPGEQKSMAHSDPFAPDSDFHAPSEERLRDLLSIFAGLIPH